jgi:hypothetical protein
MTTTYRAVLVTGLTAVLLAATAPAAAGDTRDHFGPYGRRLAAAVDTCDAQGAGRTHAWMVDCVGDLAAPDPGQPREVDLWNLFLNCLSEYYRALDEAYPSDGIVDVNECLEKNGVDVGLP